MANDNKGLSDTYQVPSVNDRFREMAPPRNAHEQTIHDLLFAQDQHDIRGILDNDP